MLFGINRVIEVNNFCQQVDNMGCNESQIKQNNSPPIITTLFKQQTNSNANLNQSLLKQLSNPYYGLLLSQNYIAQLIKQLNYSFVTANQRDSIYEIVLDYLSLSKNYLNRNSNLKTKLNTTNYINTIGQKWLKLKNQIYFNNNDALKVVAFIKKANNIKNIPFMNLAFQFDFQQVRTVSSSVKELCRYDLRAFAFLSNYLYKCCINMQKRGSTLKTIQTKLLEILDFIFKEHPPAPPLQGNQSLFSRHQSYKKELLQNQKVFINFGQFQANDRERKLSQFIGERAKSASKLYNQFVGLIQDICTKNGYHFKSGVKLRDISQKRALERIKEKLLNKSFQKFNILDHAAGIRTLDQYIKAEQYFYEKTMKNMYQQLKEKVEFKVSDLLRAKCMFATIDKINECCGQLKKQAQKRGYKIVQVDNRLRGKTGTSDIVLKILIKGTIAELQLVIDLNVASYQFSHKIYQITRSKFLTPITMLKSINQKLSLQYFNELQKIIEKNTKSQRKDNYRQHITFHQAQEYFIQFVKKIPIDLKKQSFYQFSACFYQFQDRLKTISSETIQYQSSLQTSLIHKNNCEYKIVLKDYDQALKQSKIYLQLEQNNFNKLRQKVKSSSVLNHEQRQCYLAYAYSIKNMGRIEENKGSNNKAIQYYEQFISLILIIDPNDSESIISKMQFNIAWIQYKKCNYQKSLQYYNTILANQQAKVGRQHLECASTLNNIGLVFYGQGNYPQSLKVYEQSLKIREKILGKSSFQCTSTLNNIGLVYNSLGKYSQSLMYFQRCLEIKEKFKGKESTDCALTLNNIGMVCSNQGNLQQALKNYQRSLQIRQAVKGLENIDCATALNNIGIIYFRQGNFQKALQFINRSLLIRTRVDGKESIDCSTNYMGIGQIYMKQRKWTDAINLFEKAGQIRKNVKGINSVSFASVLINLGCVYLQEGYFEKALQKYTTAHQTILGIKGNLSFESAGCKKSMGYLYLKKGQLEEAEAYLKNALQIYNTDREDQKINTAEIYVYLGEIEFKRQNLDEAKQYYEKAIKVCEKANYLYQYWAQGRRGLGNIYFQANNVEGAIKEYEKASGILVKFNEISYEANNKCLFQCREKTKQLNLTR